MPRLANRPTQIRLATAAASTTPAYSATGRRLGRAVMGYVLGVIAVITLAPFAFARPDTLRIMLWDSAFDVVANVALFVPLGFLYALTCSADARAPRPATRVALRALVLGAAASAVVETAQLFEVERYSSPLDVLTNALGAYLGARAHGAVARQLTAGSRVVGRLALELPLMGLVYLLVPLCTLDALALAQTRLGADPDAVAAVATARALELLALALFGGVVLGHVQRRHFGPAGLLSARAMAGAAAAWFALGALPALATDAGVFVGGTALAAAAAWAHGRGAPDGAPNRRFELDALARAAPYFAAYLALFALGDAAAERLTKLDVLRRLEGLVAFTVVGYVPAEAWGRQELRYRHTAGRVALIALVAGPLVEGLRSGSVPALADVPSFLARALAAAYGGWLYHLQRAHVRALVAGRAAPPTVEVRRAA